MLLNLHAPLPLCSVSTTHTLLPPIIAGSLGLYRKYLGLQNCECALQDPECCWGLTYSVHDEYTNQQEKEKMQAEAAEAATWAEFNARHEKHADATDQEVERLRRERESQVQDTEAKIGAIRAKNQTAEDRVTKAINALEEAENALNQHNAEHPSDRHTSSTPPQSSLESAATSEEDPWLDDKRERRNKDWTQGESADTQAALFRGRQGSSQYGGGGLQLASSHTEHTNQAGCTSGFSIPATSETAGTSAVRPSWWL